MKLLETEFKKNKTLVWTKAKTAELHEITGLPEVVIYKWNYDQRKLYKKQLAAETELTKKYLQVDQNGKVKPIFAVERVA